jgi:fatty acid-binding protein DegV
MSNSGHKIAIITDSTCDIPAEMRRQYSLYVASL